MKPSASHSIHVRAPARLHMGFLDMPGGLGRWFGSLGAAIDRPAVDLVASRAERVAAEGPDADRAAGYARQLLGQAGAAAGVRLQLHEAIPAHAGLGSGTQLSLSVGAAI